MPDASRDFDVIVIGAGGAGLAAAVAATQAGAHVLIVDAAPKAGGSTALSGGNILAGGTHVQAQAGVEDSPDAIFQYLSAINRFLVRPGVVRRYCDAAPETLLWLEKLGAEFPIDELRVTGAFGPPRAHRTSGHGAGLIAVLEGAAQAGSAELVTGTRVTRLLRGESGEVRGIEADGVELTAGSVVLATGGFGANAALLAEHYPYAASQGEWLWYIGTPHAQGDGLEMAAQAGAELWGRDEGLLLLTANFSRDVEIYLPGWLIFVNARGERFVNETTDYAIQSFAVQCQIGRHAFALFDEAGLERTRRSWHDMRTAFPSPNWQRDRLFELIGQGRIFKAGDLVSLARHFGADPQLLIPTIDRYNRAVRAGRDADFGKDPGGMAELTQPPFYGVELRPAVLSFTGRGPRIDEDGRVLRAGEPIAGLFAAGEVTGGLGGAVYAGNGASVGNAVVFGRIAGANAALSARRG